jgi:hypothetical protein
MNVCSHHGPELSHVTVKLDPSPLRSDGRALTAPDDVTIVMLWTDEPKLPIAPVTPPTVAEHEEKLTVPKLASGKTPPDHGASAIHSADVL